MFCKLISICVFSFIINLYLILYTCVQTCDGNQTPCLVCRVSRTDRSSHPCIAIDATAARGRMSPPRGEPSSDAAPFGRYPLADASSPFRSVRGSSICSSHPSCGDAEHRFLLHACFWKPQQHDSCSRNIHSHVTLLAKSMATSGSIGRIEGAC